MENIFYDVKHILPYQRIFNFILGNRTAGKSFSIKCMLIDDFLKKGKMFIYLTRYENELNLTNIFDDVQEIKYPELDIKIEGQKYYKIIKINEKIAGFGIPLSDYDKIKRESFVYVEKIFFDEFITENNRRYLKNECEIFLNLYQTVARGGGKAIRKVYVFFVANAVSILNPYFSFFDIVPKLGLTVEKSYLVEMFVNEKVNDTYKNTQFYNLIKNTRYGAYALENKYYLDDNSFIKNISLKNATLRMVFKFNGEIIGLWVTENGLFYCCKNYNENCKLKFCVKHEDFDEKFFLLSKSDSKIILKTLQNAFEQCQIFFASLQVKDMMLHILNYLN